MEYICLYIWNIYVYMCVCNIYMWTVYIYGLYIWTIYIYIIYIHIFFPRFLFIAGYYRILSMVPCAVG